LITMITMLLTEVMSGIAFMMGVGFMTFIYWIIIMKVLKTLKNEFKASVWSKFMSKVTGGAV